MLARVFTRYSLRAMPRLSAASANSRQTSSTRATNSGRSFQVASVDRVIPSDAAICSSLRVSSATSTAASSSFSFVSFIIPIPFRPGACASGPPGLRGWRDDQAAAGIACRPSCSSCFAGGS